MLAPVVEEPIRETVPRRGAFRLLAARRGEHRRAGYSLADLEDKVHTGTTDIGRLEMEWPRMHRLGQVRL
jgi:hypothetical protein